MTAENVSPRKDARTNSRQLSPEQSAAAAMVAEARQRGLELTGPDGLLAASDLAALVRSGLA
jgi:putative transposase